LGLSFVVQTLLSQDADVDYIGGQYGSPLSGASFFGHYDVVRILLENGSNVNIQAGVFNTPLRESIPDCRISIKIESVTKLKKKNQGKQRINTTLNHKKPQPQKTSRMSRKHLAHLRRREERRTVPSLPTSDSL
jgi:ankyrin repeat protein